MTHAERLDDAARRARGWGEVKWAEAYEAGAAALREVAELREANRNLQLSLELHTAKDKVTMTHEYYEELEQAAREVHELRARIETAGDRLARMDKAHAEAVEQWAKWEGEAKALRARMEDARICAAFVLRGIPAYEEKVVCAAADRILAHPANAPAPSKSQLKRLAAQKAPAPATCECGGTGRVYPVDAVPTRSEPCPCRGGRG